MVVGTGVTVTVLVAVVVAEASGVALGVGVAVLVVVLVHDAVADAVAPGVRVGVGVASGVKSCTSTRRTTQDTYTCHTSPPRASAVAGGSFTTMHSTRARQRMVPRAFLPGTLIMRLPTPLSLYTRPYSMSRMA